MCDFLSWIEHKGDIFCISNKELRSRDGKKLREYIGDNYFFEDITGHGAIRKYFGLSSFQGTDRENRNFRRPSEYPAVLVEKIKAGEFSLIGYPERGLLGRAARAKFNTEADRLDDAYETSYASIVDSRDKALAKAKDTRKAKIDAADEEFKNRNIDLTDFEAARTKRSGLKAAARKDYTLAVKKANDLRTKKLNKLYLDVESKIIAFFWELFSVVENRAKAWQ